MTVSQFDFLTQCGFLLSLIVLRIYVGKYQTQFESIDKNIHRIIHFKNFNLR
jgi:hypothetical protein